MFYLRHEGQTSFVRDDYEGYTTDIQEAARFNDFAEAKSNCESDEEVVELLEDGTLKVAG